MSTTMPKAGQIDRKWYVIDAAGKPLGRVAAQAAVLLRGKHKVTFAPHVDCGDHVIIINCKDAVLTGGKAEKKYYYRHTGYIGHLKATRYDTLMRTKPELAMELAVKGMIPSNSIGRDAMGTMANTLILAFAGASFNLLLLFQVYGYPMIQIFNSDTMAIELIQSISGSVGILLTVPLVSLFAALLLTRSFPKKPAKPSK